MRVTELQSFKEWKINNVDFKGVEFASLLNKADFFARNLGYMERFYLFYNNKSKLRQLVAEISWSHNLIILNKLKNEIEYYINAIKILKS